MAVSKTTKATNGDACMRAPRPKSPPIRHHGTPSGTPSADALIGAEDANAAPQLLVYHNAMYVFVAEGRTQAAQSGCSSSLTADRLTAQSKPSPAKRKQSIE